MYLSQEKLCREKLGNGQFCLLLFTEPCWEYIWWVLILLLRTAFLFVIALWVLWAQALLAFRHMCFWTHPSDMIFKRAIDAQFKLFAPQGETGSLGFPPDWMVLCMGWILWQEYVSAYPNYFVVVISSFSLCCRSHSVSFWTSLRGNCIEWGCTFGVSMEGRKFRSLVCYHLGPSFEVMFF